MTNENFRRFVMDDQRHFGQDGDGIEPNKVNSIPSVKEMIRLREMMALRPRMSRLHLPAKTLDPVETPDVKVKRIVQQFESCLKDENPCSCSKRPSHLKSTFHAVSSTTYSDSCPLLMSESINNGMVTEMPDSSFQRNISRKTFHMRNSQDDLLPFNHDLQCGSLSSEKNCWVKCDRTRTPEKDTFSSLSGHNLQDLMPREKPFATSKHANDTQSTDNSLNGICRIEVSENSTANLNGRISLDSGCNFSDHTNNTWILPKNENQYHKLDDPETNLYQLNHSLQTDMRSAISDLDHFSQSGSPKASSPLEMTPTKENSSDFYQQFPKTSEGTVTTQWILDQLSLSCPDLNVSYDHNEVCTVSKVKEVFEDLKNLLSSKKDSEKNIVSLFRENRSVMQMIKKQARELEDKYNHLHWKSFCSNRITETLYDEIKEINSDRNHLLLANKTLHNELRRSLNKIAHFERDICSHTCQKLQPQNSRDYNNSSHYFDIQELRMEIQEQKEKILQQNKIVDLLGTLINATREVLHQQEHKIKNIPGVCNLLKMIDGEMDPSSTVLEAASTSLWF